MSRLVLCWSIKESFLSYIRGSGPHRIAADPREGTIDGLFRFPALELKEAGLLHFAGRVQIEAHDGMMRLDLSNPTLARASDGSGVLAVRDAVGGKRLALVRLRPITTTDGDEETFATYLLESGEAVFGGNYPADTAFAPLHLRRGESSASAGAETVA